MIVNFKLEQLDCLLTVNHFITLEIDNDKCPFLIGEIYSNNKVVIHPNDSLFFLYGKEMTDKLYDVCFKYIKLSVFA